MQHFKDQRLKIVHISYSHKGGAGNSAYRIHKALLKARIDSHFLCLDTNLHCNHLSQPQDNSNNKKSKLLQVMADRIKWRLQHHFNISLYRQEELVKKIKEISPSFNCEIKTLPFSAFDILEDPYVKKADIIHLHWVGEILDYPSFFTKNKKPVVWTLHDMNPFQGIFHYKEDEIRNSELASVADKKIARIKNKSIRQRKSRLALVCPSQWLLESALHSAPFKNVKGYKIPYALDMEIFSRQESSALKQQMGIPESHTVFLFVAHRVSNYRKGFDLLVEAFKSMNEENITLVVIGKTDQLDIKGIKVITVGRVEQESDLAGYYSLADAFIIPSREDNLPNVMLESMACGTPVISFNIGGMKETIRNEFNGLKADKIEADELAAMIKSFINNRKHFNRDEIRNFALENYSEETIAEKYKAVYEDILT